MDEAYELNNYLPLSFNKASEERYISYLWDAFEGIYQSGKYEFASLAFHLLYMSFMSFTLWRIRSIRERDFVYALIGFQDRFESTLLNVETPFDYYKTLKESQIFRFLKLLGCENHQVGEFSKFVKNRNQIAHPSTDIFFNDQVALDKEITKMMREVANIQRHMRPVIQELYTRFLVESCDIEDRNYADPADEVRVNLVRRNYMSQKDIEICLQFDLSSLDDQPEIEGIRSLHQALISEYGSEHES